MAVVKNRWDRAASVQNRQTTAGVVVAFDPQPEDGALAAADPQQDFGASAINASGFDLHPPIAAFGVTRNAAGASSHPTRISSIVPYPASIPIPTADIIFATAKPVPRVPAAMKNCVGSINGDEIQNAITGANGTPAPSSPATSGMTPHEQKGSNAPMSDAVTTIPPCRPRKARAASESAPVAFASAATITEPASHGPICASSPAT